MEHGSIADIIRTKGGPPEWDDTAMARTLAGTAMGMKYIHSRGLTHRDLKPANIFIDKVWNPRVGDLGACRYVDPTMTAEVGTPLYRAPEVATEKADYDNSVDVFSFGMMSWEIITGKSLAADVFRGVSEYTLINALLNGKRPPLDGLDPDIGAVLARCWSGSPNDRPPFTAILEWLKTINYKIRPRVDGAQVASYVAEMERMERGFCY
jgi:serine/threonine protein kinase